MGQAIISTDTFTPSRKAGSPAASSSQIPPRRSPAPGLSERHATLTTTSACWFMTDSIMPAVTPLSSKPSPASTAYHTRPPHASVVRPTDGVLWMRDFFRVLGARRARIRIRNRRATQESGKDPPPLRKVAESSFLPTRSENLIGKPGRTTFEPRHPCLLHCSASRMLEINRGRQMPSYS